MRRQTYGYLPSRRTSLPRDWYQIYCLVTEAHVCEQLAQILTAARPGVELATSRVASQRANHYTTRPHDMGGVKIPLDPLGPPLLLACIKYSSAAMKDQCTERDAAVVSV